MIKYCMALCLFLTLIFCKEAVKHPAALPEEQVGGTEAGIQNSASGKDTVIIEKDTSAIDVKDCDVPPEILQTAKPIYSMEMIENKVEGTVKLKLLVGSDGLVKEYIMLNDLGHGTKKAIYASLTKMKFTAARKNKKRISVWIETTMYFKLPHIEF